MLGKNTSIGRLCGVKSVKVYKRIVACFLVLLVVSGIIYLTVMKLEDTVFLSEYFRNILSKTCDRFGFDASNAWWNTHEGIRRFGHVIEYFALGLAVGIATKRKMVGVFVCMAVSLLDQSLKILIPGRHFDTGDIPYDIIGFCGGLFITWVVRFIARKLKKNHYCTSI